MWRLRWLIVILFMAGIYYAIGTVCDSKSESRFAFMEKNTENHIFTAMTDVTLGRGQTVVAIGKNTLWIELIRFSNIWNLIIKEWMEFALIGKCLGLMMMMLWKTVNRIFLSWPNGKLYKRDFWKPMAIWNSTTKNNLGRLLNKKPSTWNHHLNR